MRDDAAAPGARIDFFVSYTEADRTWAEWVAWQLEEAGYGVIIQAWDFGAGSDFVTNMRRATVRAERTVAVLSRDYVASGFAIAEWNAAFAADPTGEARKLLPVRVEDFPLEGLDLTRTYVDLVGLDEAEARERLLAAVRLARAKPARAPMFSLARSVTAAPRFPGSLPTVWNMPHHRNPNFVGRQHVLDMLDPRSGSQPRSVWAIVGLGGVGKSQLVAEHAYRHLGDFEVVWWVQAEERATALRDYAELGRAVGLQQEVDLAVAAQAARGWLERHDRWLLVLDNAADKYALGELLPRGGGGQVLVTSRGGDWGELALLVPLGVLTEDEAVQLLHSRSGDGDRGSAQELAQELGYLPLALEQAAAFVGRTPGINLASYLGLFRSRQAELLALGRPLGYPATVATTWALAFQALEGGSPTAAALLRVCSFLGPDSIPLSVLVSDELPEPLAGADALDIAGALQVLGNYSLVRGTSTEGIAVHRLVQAVVRDRLGHEGRCHWAAGVLRAMRSVFPAESEDVRSWERCARLLTHALAAASHAETANVEPDDTVWVLDRVGAYLHGRAEFGEAKATFERALTIAETAFGPYSPAASTGLNNLAGVLRDQGDHAGARHRFEQALSVAEVIYGPSHPTVGIFLNNLGLELHYLGEYVRARELFERALSIAETSYGPNHTLVATTLTNLASVLSDLGELANACVLLLRALAIEVSSYGPDHPEVAVVLNNLANTLRLSGDYAGARRHLERAIAIAEAVYDADHPSAGTYYWASPR